MHYTEINAQTIDRWVENGWEWSQPISHEAYSEAKRGKWDVKLTPVKFVPHSWFGSLEGKSVLGLASGGPFLRRSVQNAPCSIIRKRCSNRNGSLLKGRDTTSPSSEQT